MVARIPGRHLERGRVRSRGRLGEAVAPELPAPGQIWEVRALLILGAEGEDRVAVERVVDGHHRGERGLRPGDLLDRETVGEGVHPAPAVLLGDEHAHESQVAEFTE